MARRKIQRPLDPPKLPELLDSGPEKDLLVGTIFCKDSPLQRKWLNLQLDFLKETTNNFDHITILYEENSSSYFSSKTEVQLLKPFATNSIAHITGLQFLAEIFRSRRKKYRNFLFLDSDAFPIRKDWQQLLLSKMTNHLIAIPVRSENLETRIHASVLFAKREALNELNFKICNLEKDLLGYPESDIMVSEFQHKKREQVFTLVRSNRINLHPVMCGIYYDCFYHHCCGSGRAYNLRSRDYWDIICNREVEVNCYTQQLMANPDEFIGKLGWLRDNYALVRK